MKRGNVRDRLLTEEKKLSTKQPFPQDAEFMKYMRVNCARRKQLEGNKSLPVWLPGTGGVVLIACVRFSTFPELWVASMTAE